MKNTNNNLSINNRDCYCEVLREKDPAYFIKYKIPDGYCGICEKCKMPGHTRSHPGAVSYTGSWCDKHYRQLAWRHPLAFPGLFIWMISLYIIFSILNILF